ncbi:MAG TPA: bifunctional glutamate N-acetyltransferase/amino-acid acetyltransferase ArgJ [Thermoplasmata archaeon]|nr:bifunctional glutamate N-acetyltransferase/amino-acid acetyltransferase ArgJ [Thermoplasmata archaeon]
MTAGLFARVEGGITHPTGFRASGVSAGVKRSMRPDLALLLSDVPCEVGALFTTNRVRASPVELCEETLMANGGRGQAIVVVSGSANALTGPEGRADSEAIVRATAAQLAIPSSLVLHAATGVIGSRIPVERVIQALPDAAARLDSDRDASARAAAAILTTDTRTKEAAITARLSDGRRFRVGGMAKGSGMIAPRLGPPHATTLAFLTTDAPLPAEALQSLVTAEGDRTFNMIRIDGDTSTNDTLLAMANGSIGGPSASDDPILRRAVGDVMERLARAIAADGEGATKLLTVHVTGAADQTHAREAAKAVAGSMLVKAAVFGADPNVGRIACAVGYSGADFKPDQLNVSLKEGARRWPLIVEGAPAPGLANGSGDRVRSVLRNESEVILEIDLGAGRADATAWGCDLSYAYVQINAAYRT